MRSEPPPTRIPYDITYYFTTIECTFIPLTNLLKHLLHAYLSYYSSPSYIERKSHHDERVRVVLRELSQSDDQEGRAQRKEIRRPPPLRRRLVAAAPSPRPPFSLPQSRIRNPACQDRRAAVVPPLCHRRAAAAAAGVGGGGGHERGIVLEERGGPILDLDDPPPSSTSSLERRLPTSRRRRPRIVLIAGFESFNRGLYERASSSSSYDDDDGDDDGADLRVFSDSDIRPSHRQPAAYHDDDDGGDWWSGSSNDAGVVNQSQAGGGDQGGERGLREPAVRLRRRPRRDAAPQAGDGAAVRLRIGHGADGAEQGQFLLHVSDGSARRRGVRKILSHFRSSKEEDKLAGYVRLLKVRPDLLKYVPGERARDLRTWLLAYSYWNQGGEGNFRSLVRLIVAVLLYRKHTLFLMSPQDQVAFGRLRALEFINAAIDNGVEITSASYGFPLVYDLLVGTVAFKLHPNDKTHNWGRILVRLVPPSNFKQKSAEMLALHILSENSSVASQAHIPKLQVRHAICFVTLTFVNRVSNMLLPIPTFLVTD